MDDHQTLPPLWDETGKNVQVKETASNTLTSIKLKVKNVQHRGEVEPHIIIHLFRNTLFFAFLKPCYVVFHLAEFRKHYLNTNLR